MAQRQGKGLGRGAADALLAVIACAWGSSYLLMKVGTGAVPPFSLIALRFGIAFVVVAAIFSRRLSVGIFGMFCSCACAGIWVWGA